MELYLTLASILTTTPSLAERLVKEFSSGDQAFFQHYFDALPTAKLARNSTKNNTVNATLFINDRSVGKGAFGLLEKNRSLPYVYKVISDQPKERLKHLKSLFREIIIQTLLICDPEYGHYVCQIYKVYKTGIGNTCIFKLERLEVTLRERIQQLNSSGSPEKNTSEVRSVMLEIFKVLAYFRTKYGFYHNDLHLENIMTTREGPITDIKLIDFGFSTVNFEGINMSKGNSSLNRKSDCLTLIYFLNIYLKNVIPEFVALLSKLLKLPEATPISDYIDLLKPVGGKRVTRRNRRLRRLLPAIQACPVKVTH
jgi:serine/threonine protein kinase